jgi:hypothetical protein
LEKLTVVSSFLWLFTCDSLSLFADPYLNTDAGTMSPFEHGEVFVLDDGGEVTTNYQLVLHILYQKIKENIAVGSSIMDDLSADIAFSSSTMWLCGYIFPAAG